MKRIALAAGISVALAFRCAGADTTSPEQTPRIKSLLVRVEVVSSTYGDFSEEKLVPLGEPVVFGPHGDSHPQFDNPNNCRMNSVDVPVVDGIKISIDRGAVFEGNRLEARITASGDKFQHYGPPAHFGWCGDVRLASKIGFDSTEMAGQFQLDRSVMIPDPAHDFRVTITFLSAPR